MRGILYAVIPAVVLGLVVANAFYGHVLFGYAYDRAINKYSVYVHLQPGWESHPGNILFDVTNVWSGPTAAAAGSGKSDAVAHMPGSVDPDDISSLTSYNRNQLQYQKSKPYVELRHEFSGCETQWRPIPYRYVADALRSWSEVASGVQTEGSGGKEAGHVEPAFAEAGAGDPYVMIFPNAPNAAYGPDVQSELVQDGYAQLIPVCVASGVAAAGQSTYDYAIMVNDPDIGFDAYFVRSAEDAAAHVSSGSSGIPAFYAHPGCHVTNHNSFAGTCHGVERGSGLLIVVPDMLDLSLTKVRVGLHERPE